MKLTLPRLNQIWEFRYEQDHVIEKITEFSNSYCEFSTTYLNKIGSCSFPFSTFFDTTIFSAYRRQK